ncbi:MAG: bifunctional hydroxymethylpyrimidine kinase/phosphomethylpyrimidine kinase [Oscillatoriales cyanobacterium SM2_1_8]|nr:bifunctional hydroxymethylpyrimidine kinase/phosphomethylpyrimidine kinase [Oscillatoriales cyanobacterium SM2_1_8]
MTIAGSDSGGGAGIQADLKTLAMHCVHGTSAITCITAQNTQGVTRVDALPPEAVAAQIEAVAIDMKVVALKTGMVLNAAIARIVAKKIAALGWQNTVVDPVAVSRAGAILLAPEALVALRESLLPLAAIVTPNRYEAQLLAEMEVNTLADMEAAARTIYRLGPRAVLVKGGAMVGDLKGVDVWYDGQHLEVLRTEAIDTPHTHGTGCTLSAAIVARLALGDAPLPAVRQAKTYLTAALRASFNPGQGQGPVGHFFPLLPA